MADNTNPIPNITNPLQTNNVAVTVIAFVSGILASKLPILDAPTWSYVIYSLGGVIAIVAPAFLNRKTAVVSTVANMTEVNKIELDKNVPGAVKLANSTPKEVVAK